MRLTRLALVLLLAAACGDPTALAPHDWVERVQADRAPMTTCLCVQPSHGGTDTSVSVWGDTLTGHEAATEAEWNDCRTQLAP